MNRRCIWVLSIVILVMTPGCINGGGGGGGDALRLSGEVWDGNKWSDFSLENDFKFLENDSKYGTWFMINFIDTNCGYCQNEASNKIPDMQNKWIGENPTRTMPNGTSVQFIAVAVTLNEDKEGWEYGKEEIVNFREEYEHDFLYMDDLDNSNRDEWEVPGTPTKFLIGPDGEIHYSTNDNEQGVSVWDTMEELIPYE